MRTLSALYSTACTIVFAEVPDPCCCCCSSPSLMLFIGSSIKICQLAYLSIVFVYKSLHLPHLLCSPGWNGFVIACTQVGSLHNGIAHHNTYLHSIQYVVYLYIANFKPCKLGHQGCFVSIAIVAQVDVKSLEIHSTTYYICTSYNVQTKYYNKSNQYT